VRENANFYLQAGWPLIRRCLQELGEQLVARGILTDRDQVHFLHKEELFGVLQATTDLAPVAAARQATWEQQQRLSPPMVIGDEGMMAQPGGWDEATKTLTGNGASPGVVRGRVHKIESAGDATRFTAGDILVIGAASPLLTPLMLSASALVVEIGGGASHSSLVARELGLPAVVNAREARMRFVNGDLVEVDGGAGTICVVDQGAGR
jgi:pyruvate,water dikinase